MRRDALRWLVRGFGFALGVLIVAALAGGVVLAGRVLILVFVAVLLASALEPLVGRVRGAVALPRAATILLVYAAFLAAVVVVAFLVIPAAVNQFNDLAARLPPLIERAEEWAATVRPRALSSSISAILRLIQARLMPGPPDPEEVVAFGITVAEALAAVGSLLAVVFFWLTEHARLQRYALAFLPAHRRPGARVIWNDIEERLGGWVRGQLILMGSVAVFTSVAYGLLGLESWILLGLLAGLAEAIPIVGPLLGAVPALIVAATISPELVVAVAIVYLIIQIVEGNVLVPYVMRNTIGISPFLVIVSLLVGAGIGGIPGAFLAVPVVAAIEVVLERLQAREVPVAQEPSVSDETEPNEADETSPEARERRDGRAARRARDRGDLARG